MQLIGFNIHECNEAKYIDLNKCNEAIHLAGRPNVLACLAQFFQFCLSNPQPPAGQRPQCDWRGAVDSNVGGEGKGAISGISSSPTTEGEEGKVASSCPSSWLKEGNLSPFPTDTTRRCPSEAGGEGRMLIVLLASNGALGAGVEGVPPDSGGAGVDSDSWAAEDEASAFAAW